MNAWKRIDRHLLDENKWQALSQQTSGNELYTHLSYLDAVCDAWDAWIKNDYEAIIPIPVRTKLGVKYAYQPEFYQRIELVAPNCKIEEHEILEILNGYLKVDITIGVDMTNKDFVPMTNYILSTPDEFKLSKNSARNFKKAEKIGVELFHEQDLTPHQIANHFAKHTRFKLSSDFAASFGRVFNCLKGLGAIQVYSAGKVHEDKNVIAVVANLGVRQTLLMLSTNEQAKKQGSAHYLISKLIEQCLNQEKIFDFEGSNHAGIARFYASFGARKETYWYYYKKLSRGVLNRLVKKM
jgi:hypothetical protein